MGLRRSTTLTRAEGGSGAASPKESLLVPGGGSLLPGSNTDTLFALRKDRSALQQDKSALLLNKRRLEGLLRKMLDGPLAGSGAAGGGGGTDEDCSSPVGSPGPGTGSPLPVLPRGANLRQAVAKALDDSSLLEKQMAAAPAVGAAAFITSAEVDSRVKEMTARMQEMQLDHEVAVSRLEGELSYRKTQAAATIAGLQKQLVDMQVGGDWRGGGGGWEGMCVCIGGTCLGIVAHEAEQKQLVDMQEELAQARRQGLQHETSQGQIKELQKEASELRQQVSRLQGALSDRTRQLSDAKDMMGLDRSTVNTLIEMLKEQLRDANATVASRSQRISELEYMVVHRDLLLSQAEDRFVRARAAESARDTAHAAWESVAHTVAAHAAAVGSGGGAFGEHKVTFKTGPGSFSAGKANGSSSGGGGGSGGGHLGMPKPSGALAPYDSYGADAFEDPSDDDE
ncbi:hypothetical protein HYH03_013074 [Edaphochlamys debaryana]|uniref:Uncharacterized protein n=1 Tax=Edaphochlamys debaryana TaxID=47281 RepID=A0A835XQH2_9CHLO|nr:hypothetical protein HYH03_013074 [Edaphochlamys debaryana]|eukprot:KAG2488388.1 hypothetical protein HYH03_013074 [Edaphochlamys debaryana]